MASAGGGWWKARVVGLAQAFKKAAQRGLQVALLTDRKTFRAINENLVSQFGNVWRCTDDAAWHKARYGDFPTSTGDCRF